MKDFKNSNSNIDYKDRFDNCTILKALPESYILYFNQNTRRYEMHHYGFSAMYLWVMKKGGTAPLPWNRVKTYNLNSFSNKDIIPSTDLNKQVNAWLKEFSCKNSTQISLNRSGGALILEISKKSKREKNTKGY